MNDYKISSDSVSIMHWDGCQLPDWLSPLLGGKIEICTDVNGKTFGVCHEEIRETVFNIGDYICIRNGNVSIIPAIVFACIKEID